MALPTTQVYTWQRENFLISTDSNLVDKQALNAAFDTDQLPWAIRLPDDELKVMVQRSLNFGIYDSSSATATHAQGPMIGYARIITDYVTVAYLTDVYVIPEYQSRGLSNWLIECVKEWWDMMSSGRRLALITAEGKPEAYYKQKLSCGRMEEAVVEEGKKRYRMVSAAGRGTGI